MKIKKQRLDSLCVEQKLFANLHDAQRGIMAGLVHDGANKLTKPGAIIKSNHKLILVKSKSQSRKYVSRGGLKLEFGLLYFKINVNDLVVCDIGSSTGGFTDCLLQNGAKLVYAIDSGMNQLAYKLRIKKNIVVMEKTNFRLFDQPELNQKIDFAVCDVSFISLKHIFPPLSKLLKYNHYFLCLIKPEFEAKRDEVIDGKVVDPKVNDRVIAEVKSYAQANNFEFINITKSPILGRVKKNTEFLALFKSNNQHLIK